MIDKKKLRQLISKIGEDFDENSVKEETVIIVNNFSKSKVTKYLYRGERYINKNQAIIESILKLTKSKIKELL